jgi:hypothetical protein
MAHTTLVLGHYRALEWIESTQQYGLNEALGISVEVTVRIQLGHLR